MRVSYPSRHNSCPPVTLDRAPSRPCAKLRRFRVQASRGFMLGSCVDFTIVCVLVRSVGPRIHVLALCRAVQGAHDSPFKFVLGFLERIIGELQVRPRPPPDGVVRGRERVFLGRKHLPQPLKVVAVAGCPPPLFPRDDLHSGFRVIASFIESIAGRLEPALGVSGIPPRALRNRQIPPLIRRQQRGP